MREQQLTIPTWLGRSVGASATTRNVILVISGSLLIAAAAQVSVPLPFTPVPMTLQPLAVLLVGALLGAKRGGAAALLYLLEGAAGLPFFASGKAGLHWVIAGPTAGYLLAYPPVAALVGWFSDRGWSRNVELTVVMMAIGIMLIHLGGWTWLTAVIGLGPREAFFAGNAPFFFGDLIKIALAAALLPALQRFVVDRRGDESDR